MLESFSTPTCSCTRLDWISIPLTLHPRHSRLQPFTWLCPVAASFRASPSVVSRLPSFLGSVPYSAGSGPSCHTFASTGPPKSCSPSSRRGSSPKAKPKRNSTMRSRRFMTSSRNTLIGRSWNGFLVSASLPQPVRISGNELIRRLKVSLKSRVPRSTTTSGPTNSCEYPPPSVTCHRRRTTSLILLPVSWNRGKGRKVYQLVMQRGMKVHRSVRTRMLARGMEGENRPYLPKIRCVIDGVPRCLTREEWLAEDPMHFEWAD